MGKLPDETKVGVVSLTVGDLQRSLHFYQDVLGFTVHDQHNGTVHLGTADEELLILNERPGAHSVRGHSGLYHFAILLPSRHDLARVLRQLADTSTPLQGASDHLVSEALYLADPDGNGIEIYRDRPRSEWPIVNGEVQMATERLDISDLLSLLSGDDPAWTALPEGTFIGHIHLHVANIPQSEQFYRDTLGLDLMVRYGPSASFLSAGGYHHHLGINTWAGPGAPPTPEDAAGLRWFSFDLPSDEALQAVAVRLEDAGIQTEQTGDGIFVRDPSQNKILLRALETTS
jgi:catechol 2,3-dioxygenase